MCFNCDVPLVMSVCAMRERRALLKKKTAINEQAINRSFIDKEKHKLLSRTEIICVYNHGNYLSKIVVIEMHLVLQVDFVFIDDD